MAQLNPVNFGAVSEGNPDTNRDAFQAMVDAAVSGDEIWVPNGRYTISKQPLTTPWCVLIDGKNLTWQHESENAVLEQRFDQANENVPPGNSNALLQIRNYTRFTFERFHAFGNKETPGGPTDYEEQPEHHRAIFTHDGDNFTFRNGRITDFTGDALQFYNNCSDFLVEDNTFLWCQRDHVTFSPTNPATAVRRGVIRRNWMEGASNQNIDNEHGPAHDIQIYDNDLIWVPNGSSSGICIAGSGTAEANPSTNWDVHHNRIHGCVKFTWCSGSKIRSNTILYDFSTMGGLSPYAMIGPMEIERACVDDEIYYNDITLLNAQVDNLAGIYVNGTLGGGAINLHIFKNNITVQGRDKVFGIRFAGPESADVYDNDITGPGLVAAGYSGIRMRSTVLERPVQRFYCARNKVRNFGNRGVDMANSLGSQIVYAEIINNVLFNDPGITSQSVGLDLGDESFVQTAVVSGNKLGPGVVTDITNTLVGPSYSITSSGVASVRDMARNVMANIDINGIVFPVYGTLDSDDPGPPDPDNVMSADSYMTGRLDASATWAAATADTRKRALVTAQRYLDTLKWKGTKTSSIQPLQWPRTGVTLSDGTAVDSTVYPTAIVYAEYDLAYAIIVNPALLTDTAQGGPGNVKRVKAGTAEVEFFKSTSMTLLPASILVSIQDYLAGGSTAMGLAVVSGVTDESIFDEFRAYDIVGAD
jgi:hypothetical protein